MAYCVLAQGESVLVERGAMATMSTGIEVGATIGGTSKALKRKILGNEGFVFATYTAQVDGSWVGIAPHFPGDVGEVTVSDGRGVLVEAGAVLAHEATVELDAKKIGRASCRERV